MRQKQKQKQKQQQKLYLYGFLAAAFIVVSFLVNRSVGSSLKDKIVHSSQEKAEPLAPSTKLNAEDPGRYGIVARKEERIPQTQGDWDAVVKKSFSHSEKLRHIKDNDVFAGIKKTPVEIEEKLRNLNDRIKKYEKIKRENPGDQETEERHQSLYMLKSTLTFLQDKISVSPKNP